MLKSHKNMERKTVEALILTALFFGGLLGFATGLALAGCN
jgi:hypothetical protein